MEGQYCAILSVIYVLLPEIAHAVLCQASQSTYVQCDTCCGAQGHQYCCDDTTRAQATEEEAASQWWIVGVCGAVSVVLVTVFIVVLFICTKKKMESRFPQLRTDNVIEVGQLNETSFVADAGAVPTAPPPYSERPPSYTSHRSRSANRYSYRQTRHQDGSLGIEPSNVPGQLTGRPPEYVTLNTPEAEVQIPQNSSYINANRTFRLQGSTVSPPPAYSRHAF